MNCPYCGEEISAYDEISMVSEDMESIDRAFAHKECLEKQREEARLE